MEACAYILLENGCTAITSRGQLRTMLVSACVTPTDSHHPFLCPSAFLSSLAQKCYGTSPLFEKARHRHTATVPVNGLSHVIGEGSSKVEAASDFLVKARGLYEVPWETLFEINVKAFSAFFDVAPSKIREVASQFSPGDHSYQAYSLLYGLYIAASNVAQGLVLMDRTPRGRILPIPSWSATDLGKFNFCPEWTERLRGQMQRRGPGVVRVLSKRFTAAVTSIEKAFLKVFPGVKPSRKDPLEEARREWEDKGIIGGERLFRAMPSFAQQPTALDRCEYCDTPFQYCGVTCLRYEAKVVAEHGTTTEMIDFFQKAADRLMELQFHGTPVERPESSQVVPADIPVTTTTTSGSRARYSFQPPNPGTYSSSLT